MFHQTIIYFLRDEGIMRLGSLERRKSSNMSPRSFARHDKMKEKIELNSKDRIFIQLEKALGVWKRTPTISSNSCRSNWEITLAFVKKSFIRRNFKRWRGFGGEENGCEEEEEKSAGVSVKRRGEEGKKTEFKCTASIPAILGLSTVPSACRQLRQISQN